MKFLLGSLAILTLSGCWMKSTRSIDINGTKYTFHINDINSLADDNKNSQYIGVWSNNRSFEIVYSSMINGRKYSKDNVLEVATLQEIKGYKFDFHKIENIDIVCVDFHKNQTCGFTIFDKGNQWSVLLNRSSIKEIKKINRQAVDVLVHSRSGK